MAIQEPQKSFNVFFSYFEKNVTESSTFSNNYDAHMIRDQRHLQLAQKKLRTKVHFYLVLPFCQFF